MPFDQLPVELYALIAKEAVNMAVREYGPSEDECMWRHLPFHDWSGRVSDVLQRLNPLPLCCGRCWDRLGRVAITVRVLHRIQRGILQWRVVCPECDYSSPG